MTQILTLTPNPTLMPGKKFFLPAILLAAVTALNAGAQEPPFAPEEFDVDIYQFPFMIQSDNFESDTIDTTYTFTAGDGSFELRYAFFAQTEYYLENIERDFALFVIPVIRDAAGFEVDPGEVELYNNWDVAEEYNGDIGVSVFIPHPPSAYGGGYAFMLLSFFFKMNQGIVMQTVLFNDIEFAGTEEFLGLSHSFRFHE